MADGGEVNQDPVMEDSQGKETENEPVKATTDEAGTNDTSNGEKKVTEELQEDSKPAQETEDSNIPDAPIEEGNKEQGEEETEQVTDTPAKEPTGEEPALESTTNNTGEPTSNDDDDDPTSNNDVPTDVPITANDGSTAANDDPKSTAANDDPKSTVANDDPKSTAANDDPKSTAANDGSTAIDGSITAANTDEPTAAANDDPTAANDDPTAANDGSTAVDGEGEKQSELEQKSKEPDSNELTKPNKEEEPSTDKPNEPSPEEKENQTDENQTDENQTDEKQTDEKQSVSHQTEEKQTDEKQTDEKQTDEKQSDEKQTDEKQTEEKQSDEKQSDDKQTDEKQTDEKQSDEKQTDEKQSDEKQSDDKQTDEKQSDGVVVLPPAPPPTASKSKPTNETQPTHENPAIPGEGDTREVQGNKNEGGVIEKMELPLEKLKKGEEEEKSLVETAVPGQTFDVPSPSTNQPLSLTWSYGFNHNVPVHNISTDDKKMIFYTCSHTGIMYDCKRHRQFLLQGHGHPITCTAVSGDRRWLATADVGTDPLIIIWDSYSGIPVRTFYNNLGQGIVGVAMSQDARYLATIGCQVPQVVSVWDWTNERESPVQSVVLSPDYGIQTYITFSHNDSSLLASNSDDQVIFYKWTAKGLYVCTTPVSDRDFNKSVGLLSQTVFLPDGSNHWALTGTSEGCIVVWETSGLYHNQEMRPLRELTLEKKKPVRLMKLHDYPVTAITTINHDPCRCIVTGDSVGHVKFFDKNLKLLYWYTDLCTGPIASVSFAYSIKLMTNSSTTSLSGYPNQSLLSDDIKLIIPDFTISTSVSSIIHLSTNGRIRDVILEDHDSTVSALTTHPSQPLLLVGSYSKKLKLWNYSTKEVVMSRQLSDQLLVQCMSYDPKGEFVGLGFTGGQVLVVDSVSLHDVSEIFHYSKDTVTLLSFSNDSHYMATADLDHTITLYVSTNTPKGRHWSFLARHRAHYKKIEAILFGVFPDSGEPRLFSLGSDRKLVEYDLCHSSEDDLRLLSIDRIEQTATPTSITWCPPLSVESFVITANNEYKIKLYNCTTKMCRKTLLGPTFGSPIRKMIVLPKGTETTQDTIIDDRRYLVYITNDKVGLLILPHDGNPYNSICLTAHPEQISDVAVAYDGSCVFTAGGKDCVVNQWNINTDSLEAHSLLGGEGLLPFYALIEGGREGEFFAQLEEYFYYAQLRTQGTDCMKTRIASVSISIEQIPYVMRAIGYYPSEHEIDNMLNEVKFSRYVDKGGIVTDIDLGQFIQLYINHRPVFGLLPADIAQSFKMLGKRRGKEKNCSIERTKLLQLLQEKGEHFTESELVDYLMTLVSTDHFLDSGTDGGVALGPAELLKQIPEFVTAKDFVEEMLCLSVTDS